MTYGLTIERIIDAPAEVVFDTIVDPTFQDEIFADLVEGWTVLRFEFDLRLGGTWTIEFGPRTNGPPDLTTRTFTGVDRPRQIASAVTMEIAHWDWGGTIRFSESITFEDQRGKTLLTIVQSGLESEADRDTLERGTVPYVDSVRHVAEARMTAEGRKGA